MNKVQCMACGNYVEENMVAYNEFLTDENHRETYCTECVEPATRTITISNCTCGHDEDSQFYSNHGTCEWCAFIGDFEEEHQLNCKCHECEKHDRKLAEQALEIFDLNKPETINTINDDLPF